MEIRQLEYFRVIASYQNLTRAAEDYRRTIAAFYSRQSTALKDFLEKVYARK
jgi:DNA-binding transcriptional LysR family regulator